MARILVADDDHDAAELLAQLFAMSGHEAQCALNGRDAVLASKMFAPTIIFLDLEMPVLDGFGAAAAIKGDPQTYHMYLVALSGAIGADIKARTERAGFDFYFCKPASTDALLALVTELASSARPQALH
jgi:CheY-like chemotaxis protein